MVVKGDLDAETAEMLSATLSPLSTPRPTDDAGPDIVHGCIMRQESLACKNFPAWIVLPKPSAKVPNS